MAEEAQQSWLAAHWKLLAILASVFVVIILVVVLAVVLSRGPLPCEKGDGQKDPEITAISIPASSANGLCPDIDGNTNITIEGENFFRHKLLEDDDWEVATVTVDGKDVDSHLVECEEVDPKVHNRIVEVCTQIVVEIKKADWPSTVMNAEVEVTNPDPCDNTASKQVDINSPSCSCTPTVLAFFVDPPATFNQVDLTVTLYLSQVVGTTPLQVRAKPAPTNPGGAVGFPLTNEACVGGNCNKLQATVPSGQAAGRYKLVVEDASSCPPELDFEIKGTATISIDVVTPQNLLNTVSTPITITTSGTPMASTPRVYMSQGTTATQLNAVNFVSATQITAVIPPSGGGQWDLIIVNPGPGFDVGSRISAFTVQATPPPVVKTVQPYSIEGGSTGASLTLYGENFPASGGFNGSLVCSDFATNTAEAQPRPFNSVTRVSATEVTVVAGTAPANDYYCDLILVTSTGSFTYSTIFTISSSSNIADVVMGPALNIARFQHAYRSVLATAASRAVVAAGGRINANNNTDTVESAGITRTGTQSFHVQRNRLPAALAGHRMERIGNYLYVLGGNTAGQPASDKLYRAHVLNPLATPTITDLDVDIAPTGQQGLAIGTYFYRVAATFGAGYVVNPSGESLPGDAAVLDLPVANLHVSITWSPVNSAAAYKVYRSPTPNAALADMEYLATVSSGLTYTDDGQTATTGGPCNTATPGPMCPLRVGDVGVWSEVATHSMSSPRTRFASVAVPTNGQTAGLQWNIMVMGGEDAGGNPLASTEYLEITITPGTGTTSETHAYGTWTASGAMVTAMTDVTAYAYGAGDSATTGGTEVVGANQYRLYVNTGVGAAGATPQRIQVADQLVESGTALSAITWADTATVVRNEEHTALSAYPRFLYFSGDKNSGELSAFNSFTNINAGLTDGTNTRRRHDVVKDAGLLFVAGGVLDNTGASTTPTTNTGSTHA